VSISKTKQCSLMNSRHGICLNRKYWAVAKLTTSDSALTPEVEDRSVLETKTRYLP
jgi:hypothetical protein